MVRGTFVWLHRWAGLAMSVILVIVSLTGSAIAFHDQIDAWLNPELVLVPRRDAPLLDPIALRERAAAQCPDGDFNLAVLHIDPDRAVRLFLEPKTSSTEEAAHNANHGFADLREVFFDPYNGEKLGDRIFLSGPTLERRNLLGFLFRLHYSLSAPWSWNIAGDNAGGFMLGVTALIWTIDCFMAFYLTFPMRLRIAEGVTRARRSWWRRWVPAWLIRTHSGFYRFNFDVHRAFGLWTWAMLFVFAWSGVHFNLDRVYSPAMTALFGAASPPAAATARKRIENPALGWREAYDMTSNRMRAEAERRGFQVVEDVDLFLVREAGEYILATRLVGDVNRRGANSISIDADTGAMVSAAFERDLPTSETVTNWLASLHDAGAFGLPMKIVVCTMGFVITVLSVTGIYVWWKKRRGRNFLRSPDAGSEACAASSSCSSAQDHNAATTDSVRRRYAVDESLDGVPMTRKSSNNSSNTRRSSTCQALAPVDSQRPQGTPSRACPPPRRGSSACRILES